MRAIGNGPRSRASKDPLSYLFFGDEQDSSRSLLFGGFLIKREKLSTLDDGVVQAKRDAGLDADDPVKWSPPQDPAYEPQRALSPEKRRLLTQRMLALLHPLEAACFFSLVWKYTPQFTTKAYNWAFSHVLQRLALNLDRLSPSQLGYPSLDVVVDWFPSPDKCRQYFEVYNDAFYEGYRFRRNRIPPLRHFGATPCLLVTRCQFSRALQLVDYCVGSVGELLRWAYKRHKSAKDIRELVEPVANHLLEGPGGKGVIGYGLIPPTQGLARQKIQEALDELGL